MYLRSAALLLALLPIGFATAASPRAPRRRLSHLRIAALGLLLLIEAVRQLRGEAGDRQVANAKIGVAHGVGGLLSTAGTVVLARE